MTPESIIALATPLAVIVAAVLQQMSANKAKADRVEIKDTAAVAVERNERKLETIAKTAESVHILVNSSMSAQLKISAVALRRVADLTRHPDDAAAAELAEKLLAEHEAKQKLVDSKAGQPAA